MKKLIGSPGNVSGLILRIAQFLCAAASIGGMVSARGFSGYTAFWYISCIWVLIIDWFLLFTVYLVYSICDLNVYARWYLGLVLLYWMVLPFRGCFG